MPRRKKKLHLDITKIHVYYRNFDGRLFHKQLKPEDKDDIDTLKEQIGDYVDKIDNGKYEYYYVVFQLNIQGETAYANAIGKTFFEESDRSELDSIDNVFYEDEEKYLSGTTLR